MMSACTAPLRVSAPAFPVIALTAVAELLSKIPDEFLYEKAMINNLATEAELLLRAGEIDMTVIHNADIRTLVDGF
jgi:hypothetical protein